MQTTWGTWTDLSIEYGESKEKILNHRKRLKGTPKNRMTSEKEVEQELAVSMGNDLTQMHKEIQKKYLYAYRALSHEDLENIKLTKRQRQILELRLEEKTFQEIAEEINCDLKNVFKAYKMAVKKIERYKDIKKQNVEKYLSPQQKEIYKLKKKGMKNKEVAQKLNTSIDNIKKQLKKISIKIGDQKSTKKN